MKSGALAFIALSLPGLPASAQEKAAPKERLWKR
jgi:hypothetical protein